MLECPPTTSLKAIGQSLQIDWEVALKELRCRKLVMKDQTGRFRSQRLSNHLSSSRPFVGRSNNASVATEPSRLRVRTADDVRQLWLSTFAKETGTAGALSLDDRRMIRSLCARRGNQAVANLIGEFATTWIQRRASFRVKDLVDFESEVAYPL